MWTLWFCFGVMGGDMQPQGQVQVLINMIDFGMDVQQAGSAPRLYHVGSAEPTGTPADPDGGTVHLEPGFKPAVVADLAARGHKVERSDFAWGGYQGIRIDHDNGCLHGGSEIRNDGCAAGY